MKIAAAVMAGGSGERFWPLSKKSRPKQFLSLLGGPSMIRQTVNRLGELVRPEDIYVVTLQEYKGMIMEELPSISGDRILVEHCGKDTAAALGLAAVEIGRRDPDAVVIMLPADHYIADPGKFLSTLRAAAGAASGGDHVVTLGIPPVRPETGYGYILKGDLYGEIDGLPVHRAVSFTEKPSPERAVQYVNNGNYFWNSGIFIWRVDLIRRLIESHIPELEEGLKAIETAPDEERKDVIKKVYGKLPRLSVDYGILEKTRNILVIEGDFGWDDLGSWTSLERIEPSKDVADNVVRARGVFLDARSNVIISPHRVVAAMGISNLIVVDDGHNLLICSKDRAQDIKKLICRLQQDGYEDSI